ncbi:MAG: RNA polymerase sigma factor, partial [Acidimicrobiia bacterium]
MNEDLNKGLTLCTDASDGELTERVHDGDRTAFGVLYLRHHGAAWRMARVASGFTDDAEIAVIEGFSAVFAASGHRSDFRQALQACVRASALRRRARQRARGRIRLTRAMVPLGRTSPAGGAVPGEHEVRERMRALPEARRTALWLTDVEAQTPAEVASAVGLAAASLPGLVAEARDILRGAGLRRGGRVVDLGAALR